MGTLVQFENRKFGHSSKVKVGVHDKASIIGIFQQVTRALEEFNSIFTLVSTFLRYTNVVRLILP